MKRKKFIHDYDISVKCRVCGKEYKIPCNFNDLRSYMKGKLIQRAFPYMPSDYRELLMTRTCGKCFNNLIKE